MKNPLTIYQNMSSPKKVSLWATFNNIALKAVAVITIPIFTRLMPPEQFGVTSVYLAVISVLSIFATLGLSGQSFYNGVMRYEKDKDRFVSSQIGLSAAITVVVFYIYIIFPQFWNGVFNLPTFVMCLMFAEILFATPKNIWLQRERSEYRYKLSLAVTLANTLLIPALGLLFVICAQADFKGIARVFSFSAVAAVLGIPLAVSMLLPLKKDYRLHPKAERKRPLFVKEYWKFGLMYNIPLLPHLLSGVLLNSADRLMIDSMAGRAEAGIYSIAYSVSMLPLIIVNGINTAFVPVTYKNIQTGNYKSLRKNTNAILIMIAGIVTVLTLAAPEAIMIFAPPVYAPAVWIVPAVSASVFFICISGFFTNVELYFEKTKLVSAASVVCAVLNVLLNLIFIPMFGYFAAGYTTFGCYILFAILHFVFMRKICREKLDGNTIYDIKFMFLLSAVVIVSTFVITLTYNTVFIRYGLIAVIGVGAFVKRKPIMDMFTKKV